MCRLRSLLGIPDRPICLVLGFLSRHHRDPVSVCRVRWSLIDASDLKSTLSRFKCSRLFAICTKFVFITVFVPAFCLNLTPPLLMFAASLSPLQTISFTKPSRFEFSVPAPLWRLRRTRSGLGTDDGAPPRSILLRHCFIRVFSLHTLSMPSQFFKGNLV